ncbi:MAG: hypothetical protein ACFFE8_01640 [Candidatus Heimdallarchaeota archaeon]
MSQKEPKRRISFDNVPSYTISGFFGGINPNEGNISFFQDNLIPRTGEHPGQIVLDTVEHKFMLNIRMAPAVWKRMAAWMLDHVKRFEQQHGEIQIGPPRPQEDSDPPSFYG